MIKGRLKSFLKISASLFCFNYFTKNDALIFALIFIVPSVMIVEPREELSVAISEIMFLAIYNLGLL